jgi:pimeloyl-ACP methyl ester carboxylesterase
MKPKNSYGRQRRAFTGDAPAGSRWRGLALLAALAVVSGTVACGSDGSDTSADRTTTTSRGSDGEPATTSEPITSAPRSSSYVIDGRTVSMPCEGEGSIPVVLHAGGTDPHSVWDDLVAALGPDVLTCRFDAPGVGDSDPPAAPVTASARADALDATLTAAGLDGQVVLVAHSLAGQTARQLGSRHPERLAGAVLLDPTTRVVMHALHADLTADGWDAVAAEAEADAEVAWPVIPLVVLSHDPALGVLGPPVVEELWTEGQAEYAALSAASRHEVVTGSGHYLHRDATPVVAAAILEVLSRVREPE